METEGSRATFAGLGMCNNFMKAVQLFLILSCHDTVWSQTLPQSGNSIVPSELPHFAGLPARHKFAKKRNNAINFKKSQKYYIILDV